MKVVLLCLLGLLVGFAAGWVFCEWTEQELQKEQRHMTVIPPPIQQVP